MTLLRALSAMLLLALAAGCGPTVGQAPAAPEKPTPTLVWPPPPTRARIRFVKAVASSADLGVRRSFWQRAGEAIVGRQEEWLIRPIGVATKGSTIYVADPGAQALWLLDAQRGRFQKTHRAGAQPLVSPVAVAVGREDRIYVADSFLGKVLVYGAGLTLKATIAGGGLERPAGLAFDDVNDRLYVADTGAHRVWIYTGEGKTGGAIGRRGTGDGEFNFPTHVAVDHAGSVYVTDSLGFRVQIFDRDGRFARGFGRLGDTAGEFARPKGVALDSDGHVYVVEALFDAVQIFDRQGRYLLSFGERGLGSGQFWLPVGVFIDPEDRIYVADSYNQRIQIFQYLAGGGDE